jgi:phage terminase large subunit-like protein
MGRPAKTLAAHVLEGTFRSRRHHRLLAGAELPWSGLAVIQARFRAATSEAERRAISVQFQQAVTLVHEQTSAAEAGAADCSFDDGLALLGGSGTTKQLLAFFPRYLRHAKGPLYGTPFVLEAWQKQFLREFNRRDKKGRRLYQRGLLGVPRGMGKTPLAAGLALYELVTRTDAPEVYFAAGSKEQAGIGMGFARAFVEQGELAQAIAVGRELHCRQRPGVLKVISSEGTLQHGRAPSAAFIDELWGFSSERQEETYTALSTATHKRPDAFLLSITTAGFDRQSLLAKIYQQALQWDDVTVSKDGCLTVAKDPASGYLLWWYGAPDDAEPDDPKILRATNPGSWVTVPSLLRQLHDPGLDESTFRRLHLNQWTTTEKAWLPGHTWRDLASELQIPDRAPVYVGVDIGISHDCSAVSWAHPHPDGKIVLRTHVWSADERAHAHTHVAGGRSASKRSSSSSCNSRTATRSAPSPTTPASSTAPPRSSKRRG